MSKVTFILALALLVIVVLYWRTCHSSPLPSPTKSDNTVDSIVKKAIADSIILGHVVDSLQDDNVRLEIRNDSLLQILTNAKGELKGKDKDIQGLVESINSAEAKKDTAGALTACDSLKAAYPVAKGLVTQYIKTNDSLIQLNAQISHNKDTIIGRLSSAYNEANSMLFETSRQYGLISADYKKALKQSGKKWGIGPGIGGTVVNGKFQPILDISIHYDLFKF